MSKQRLSQTRDSFHAPTLVLWAGAAMTGCFVLSACSERNQTSPPASAAATPAQREPSIDVASLQKLSAKVTAGGIATSYDAYFDAQQLKAIVEERRGSSATAQGEYLYMGARLMQYAGNALPLAAQEGTGTIELKFDLQGRLLSARNLQYPARTVDQVQIDALRARAELLRSHALAQHSVNAHQRTEEERG